MKLVTRNFFITQKNCKDLKKFRRKICHYIKGAFRYDKRMEPLTKERIVEA